MKFQKIYSCILFIPFSSIFLLLMLYPRISWLCTYPIHICFNLSIREWFFVPLRAWCSVGFSEAGFESGNECQVPISPSRSHKLPSMWWWSGSMLISIPVHCGFIAYLLLARGKHFPNNIYISHALVCGSFSSVLLVNVMFGLGVTLDMNWPLNLNHQIHWMHFPSIPPCGEWYQN